MQITLTDREKAFFIAYLEAIDFTETGDLEQPEPGAILDPDFYRESMIDCLAFDQRSLTFHKTNGCASLHRMGQ